MDDNKIKIKEYIKTLPVCSICLLPLGRRNKKVLFCKHAYHWRCIDKWLKNHNNCPLCRDIQCKECRNNAEAVDTEDDAIFFFHSINRHWDIPQHQNDIIIIEV